MAFDPVLEVLVREPSCEGLKKEVGLYSMWREGKDTMAFDPVLEVLVREPSCEGLKKEVRNDTMAFDPVLEVLVREPSSEGLSKEVGLQGTLLWGAQEGGGALFHVKRR